MNCDVKKLRCASLRSALQRCGALRFGVYQKACFQGKKEANTYTPRIVGDPFAQYWCTDFGLEDKRFWHQVM